MLGLEREGTRGGGEEVEVEQSLDWLIVNSLAQKRIIMIILLLLLFVAAFQMKSNTIEQQLWPGPDAASAQPIPMPRTEPSLRMSSAF